VTDGSFRRMSAFCEMPDDAYLWRAAGGRLGHRRTLDAPWLHAMGDHVRKEAARHGPCDRAWPCSAGERRHLAVARAVTGLGGLREAVFCGVHHLGRWFGAAPFTTPALE
jgi:hypothetical protein